MSADKIFINGKIHTVNSQYDIVESVAIKDGKIFCVGNNDESMELYEKGKTEVVDLKGKMMLPGFIDAHCHPVLAAFFLLGLYIEIDWSVEEVLDSVKKFVKENPGKKAYFGIGYLETLFDEMGPQKELLDEICPDKPIVLLGSSGHEGWCNSKALEVSNINKETPDPVPGFQFYRRDGKGNATGHIIETACVANVLRKVDPFDRGEIKRKLISISKEYASMGITSLFDMGSFMYMEEIGIPIVAELVESKDMLQKFVACGGYVCEKEHVPNRVKILKGYREKYHSDKYNFSFLKIVNDGTIEARSASMVEPYSDGTQPGVLLEGEQLINLCLEAAKEGFDIHIHGIGDKAAHETIMVAKALRENGYHDTRVTNAHTQAVSKEDLELFGKYNVVANTTTVWHYTYPGLDRLIGQDRADNTYMLHSIIKGGAKMSIGSDFPVDEYGREPLKGIEMGVTRMIYDRTDRPVLKPATERLNLQQCIKGYTIDAAYQTHMEKKIGSIEIGKYADLVVLDQNIFDVDVRAVHNIKPVMTLIDGIVVYEN